MTIRALCPFCQQELAFDDKREGGEAECDWCRGGVRVPRLIRYQCFVCHHRYASAPHHAGRSFHCLECREKLRVPEATTTESPAPAPVPTFGQHIDRSEFEETDPGADHTGDDWFLEDEHKRPWTAEGAPQVGPAALLRRDQATPAGFWRRVAAFGLDAVILGVAQFLVGFLLGAVLALAGVADGLGLGLAILGDLTGTLLAWTYFAALESSPRQATIGKMALGLAVTDSEGDALSFWRASGRWWAKLLSTLPCGLGFVMIAFTPRKQGLHDLIAGTLVVLEE